MLRYLGACIYAERDSGQNRFSYYVEGSQMQFSVLLKVFLFFVCFHFFLIGGIKEIWKIYNGQMLFLVLVSKACLFVGSSLIGMLLSTSGPLKSPL